MELNSIQKEAVNSINLDNINFGTIHSTMRTGKTAISIFLLVKYKYKNVLWICNDAIERDVQLAQEFHDWGFSEYYDSCVTAIHHKSLHKYDISKYDIIVFNEIQNITFNIYQYISFANKILGLTGTYPNNLDKQSLLTKLGLDNIIFNYDILHAVKDEIISDYQILIKFIPVSAIKNIEVVTTTNSYFTSEEKTLNNYESQLSIIDSYIKPLSDEKKLINTEIDSYGNYYSQSKDVQKRMRSLYGRTASLGNELKPYYERKKNMLLFYQKTVNTFQSKVDYAKEIIRNNPDKRILIFSGDNAHAKLISDNIYSSQTNTIHFTLFREKRINHLVLVNKGSVGTNYDDIDIVIHLAPNKSNTSVIQKLARSLKKKKIDSIVKMYIPYSSARQLDWIKQAIENMDQNKIKYI
jgi:superfamily II DNA or RNA helicase